MTRQTAVAMMTSGQLLAGLAPNTASTDGPITMTGLSVPIKVPVTISHPVRNPRYGLIARPTHSNDAPQFAFHMFSRRYALAMISIGIAVRIRIGPDAYAVSAASAASDSPTVAAGAGAVPATVAAY